MQAALAAVSALIVGLVLGRSTRRAKPAAVKKMPQRPVHLVPGSETPPLPVDGVAPRPPAGQPRRGAGPLRLVFGAVLIALGVVAAVYFAYELRSVITLTLVALLLAVGLQAPVAYLRGLGLPRPIGLLVIYVAVIAGFILAGWLLVPPIISDLRAFVVQAPGYLSQAEAQVGRLGIQVEIPRLEDLERRVLTEVSGDIGSYVNRVFSILGFAFGLFGGVLNAFFVLILSIFILSEGPAFREHLLSLMSPEHERRWTVITQKIADKIQGWMLGTLLLGLIIGGATTIFLLLIGMPYAFLFGLVAGVGELIPMIGPIIAAVPAVGIAAFQGWGTFGWVLLFYILVQQVENYILVPRIMGSAVDLPGLGVLIAFLVGSELLGVTGAILAMPSAAIIHVLWFEWIVPAIRGDDRSPDASVQVTVGAPATPATQVSVRSPAR